MTFIPGLKLKKVFPIKIAFISHLADLSGAPKCLYCLLKYIDKKKYEPIVILPSTGPLVDKLAELGCKIRIINKFTLKENIIIKLLQRLWYCLPLFIVFLREKPDLVYLNSIFNSGSAIIAKICRIPCVTHVHESKWMFNHLGRVRLKIILFSTDYFICVSNASRKVLLNCGVEVNRTRIVHNGVDHKEFRTRRTQETPPPLLLSRSERKKFLIGVIAVLEKRKGIHIFIKAAHEVLKSGEECNFVVVGGRPLNDDLTYYNYISGMVKDYELSNNFEFVGYKADIKPFLSHFDVVCIPSLDEPFSLVSIEAMCMEKPVIASLVGGLRDIIVNGKTGLFFTKGDYMELARLIIMLKNTPDLRVSMGENGRKRVEQYFSMGNYISGIEDALEGLQKL